MAKHTVGKVVLAPHHLPVEDMVFGQEVLDNGAVVTTVSWPKVERDVAEAYKLLKECEGMLATIDIFNLTKVDKSVTSQAVRSRVHETYEKVKAFNKKVGKKNG